MGEVARIYPGGILHVSTLNRAATRSAGLALSLAIALPLLCWGLATPWLDETGYNGAWMSSCARNTLRYGLAETGLLQVRNDGPADPEHFLYYVHHPPGVPLLVAASFATLGESEAAARLVPILFTLLSVVVVYRVVRKAMNHRTATLAAGLLVLMPMTALFGRMVNHEAVTLFWMLLLVDRYLEWRHTRMTRTLATMGAVFCAGALCGWPMFYLGGLIPVHAYLAWALSHRSGMNRGSTTDSSASQSSPNAPRRPIGIVILPLLGLAVAGAIVGTIYLRTGSDGLAVLSQAFLARSGSQGYEESPPTARFVRSGGQPLAHGMSNIRPVPPGEFVARHAHRAAVLFTPVGISLAGLAGVASLRRRWRNTIPADLQVAIGLTAAAGVVHVLLFRQGAWNHDYWMYYLAAPIAVAGAVGLDWLLRAAAGAPLRLGIVAAVIVGHAGLGMYIIQKHHRQDPGLAWFDMQLGLALRDTVDGQVLATNLPFRKPFAAHYAMADIVWEVRDQRTLQRAVAESGATYYLVDPNITAFSPTVGPQSDHPAATGQVVASVFVAGRPLELRSIPEMQPNQWKTHLPSNTDAQVRGQSARHLGSTAS